MTNLETEPAPLPPPTPTPRPQPQDRRWARSDDRVVLGVAAGLGRALAIEPLFVRIAFVVLALFGGVGIVLYIAALAVLADSPTSPPASTTRRIVGAVVVFLAARWLFSGEAELPDAGWVLAIGLLGVAAALWRGRSPVDAQSLPPAEPALAATDGGSTSDRWGSWTAQRRERPRPPQSPLGLLTIGAAIVIGTLVWLFNESAGNRGAWAFGWATVILGGGLLVGTFAGRARWLIGPALMTGAAAVVASALSFAGAGITERTGNQTVYIDAGSNVAARYETGMGNFDLILTEYPSDLATTVEVGIGNLTVVVPDNAHVQIDARVGIGSIDAFGSTRSGYRRSLSLDDQPDGAHMITLKLRVGAGEIEVRRGSFLDGVPILTPPTFLPDVPVHRSFGDGTVLFDDGSIDFGDGWRIEVDGSFQIPIIEQREDGSVQLDNGAVIQADGTVVSPGGFLIPSLDADFPTSLPVVTTEVQP
jgi:phage shock protein PspC (stress-responsive transcriptional regulator)